MDNPAGNQSLISEIAERLRGTMDNLAAGRVGASSANERPQRDNEGQESKLDVVKEGRKAPGFSAPAKGSKEGVQKLAEELKRKIGIVAENAVGFKDGLEQKMATVAASAAVAADAERKIEAELGTVRAELEAIAEAKSSLEKQLEAARAEATAARDAKKELERELTRALAEVRHNIDANGALEKELGALRVRSTTVEDVKGRLEEELVGARSEMLVVRAENDALHQKYTEGTGELKARLGETEKMVRVLFELLLKSNEILDSMT